MFIDKLRNDFAMYDIFISYRRDGGEALACLLCTKLRQIGCAVFYDVESLRSGKFNTKILSVIQKCTDVIVVLSEHALDRCGDENDWVRKEISYSIKHNKNIIPVMMRNFQWPKTLPSEMSELKNYNGISANGSVKNFVALVKNSSFLVRITDMTILIEKEFIYGSSKVSAKY